MLAFALGILALILLICTIVLSVLLAIEKDKGCQSLSNTNQTSADYTTMTTSSTDSTPFPTLTTSEDYILTKTLPTEHPTTTATAETASSITENATVPTVSEKSTTITTAESSTAQTMHDTSTIQTTKSTTPFVIETSAITTSSETSTDTTTTATTERSSVPTMSHMSTTVTAIETTTTSTTIVTSTDPITTEVITTVPTTMVSTENAPTALTETSQSMSDTTTYFTGPCQLCTTTTTPFYDQCSFNLVFILDESSRIGPANFSLVKEAIKNVTSEAFLTVSQSQTRVGWVGFSDETWTDPSQIQLLNQAISNQQTNDDMDKITYHPGSSNPARAFNYTSDFIFVQSNGDRPIDYNHKDLLFLISNGVYNDDNFADASTTAATLRDRGVPIYAAAVGDCEDDFFHDNCNEKFLHHITGVADYSHVLAMSKYEEMGDMLAGIVKGIRCPQPPPIPPVCHGDIVFVLDKSQNFRWSFAGMVNVLLAMSFPQSKEGLTVDGDTANLISLVSFDREPNIDFDLTMYKNNDDINSYIRRNYHDSQYVPANDAGTAKALQTVLYDVLIPGKGDRFCSPNVVILASCGKYDFGEDPAIVAQQLRDERNAVIVSYCFGHYADFSHFDELRNISGDTGMVIVSRDDGIDDFVAQIVNFVNLITCKYERV